MLKQALQGSLRRRSFLGFKPAVTPVVGVGEGGSGETPCQLVPQTLRAVSEHGRSPIGVAEMGFSNGAQQAQDLHLTYQLRYILISTFL